MCGRFSQSKDKQTIKKRFNVKKVADEVIPLFNVAPDQDVAAILNDSPDEIKAVRWGLIPSWSKEEKHPYNMINAKSEELLEKVSYKRLIRYKRCIVIAESFYEWKKPEADKDKKSKSKTKIPYRILLKNEDLFAFAGLWDIWEKDGKKIISCSIITAKPNILVAGIHDRMPVILPQALEKEWLSDIPVEKALAMLEPYDSELMKAYTISRKVNIPTYNAPDIHEEFAYQA